MELSLSLIYRCVQIAAVVFIAAWLILRKNKTAAAFFRGLALFTAIVSPILLYLSKQEKTGLPIKIYLAISGIVFLVFAIDKAIAVDDSNRSRVPENTLLLLSVFGILGGISGMLVFHHKNKKAKLQYCMPIIAFVEIAVLYLFRLRKTLPAFLQMLSQQSFDPFPALTILTTFVVCIVLIRTFILVRLLVTIPVSLVTGLTAVEMIFKMDQSLSSFEVIKAKPLPFLGVALLTFLILEVIAMNTKFFTSGDEVRKKTDHSKDHTR